MLISGVDSTDLFTGPEARPLQVVRVRVANAGPDGTAEPGAAVALQVTGRGIGTPEPVTVRAPAPGGELVAEVAIDISPAVAPGTQLPVLATATWPGGAAELAATVSAA